MPLQEFTNQVGPGGAVGHRGCRHRPPDVSQHSEVEEHNKDLLSVGHEEVSRLKKLPICGFRCLKLQFNVGLRGSYLPGRSGDDELGL